MGWCLWQVPEGESQSKPSPGKRFWGGTGPRTAGAAPGLRGLGLLDISAHEGRWVHHPTESLPPGLSLRGPRARESGCCMRTAAGRACALLVPLATYRVLHNQLPGEGSGGLAGRWADMAQWLPDGGEREGESTPNRCSCGHSTSVANGLAVKVLAGKDWRLGPGRCGERHADGHTEKARVRRF